MTQPTLGLLLTTLLCLVACGETDPAEPAGGAPPRAETAAETAAAEVAAQPAAARKASEKVQGTWAIVLSDEERRQVEVLQLALKDPPPTEADMAKLSLTEDERTMVALLGAARVADPSDPKVAEMKAAADGLATATVTITADKMTFQAGTVTETSTYVVQSETEGSVTIKSVSAPAAGEPGDVVAPAEEEIATITFEGDDRMVMSDAADPTRKQTFTRK